MKHLLPSLLLVAFAMALAPALGDVTEITPKAAFAQSKYENERGPEYAINNSGMAANGTHGVTAKGTMWMGSNSGSGFARWFVVDLGAVYALDSMKIWNFNMNNGTDYSERGVKQIDIYVSTTDADFSGTPNFSDAATWTLFKENHIVARATAQSTYAGDTPVDFQYTSARWVGFYIDSLYNNSSSNGQKGGYGGLSEVKFYRSNVSAAISLTGVAVSSATSATLSGSLWAPDGIAHSVRAVYAPASAGDDPSIWTSSTASTSLTEGDFSIPLTNLAADAEYRAALLLDEGKGQYSTLAEFSTAAISVAVPADFYESDTAAKSIVFSRPAGASSLDLTVGYSLGGTAVAGTDYATLSGNVVIAAGDTSASVSFQPIDNGATDGTRTVSVSVGNGLYVSGATATFSILDDEGDAVECVWTGSGDGTSWDDAANWQGNRIPTAIDTAVFGSASSGATITLGASRAVAAIRAEGSGTLALGTSGDKTAGYTLSAAHLSRTGESAGQLTVAAPFSFTNCHDGTNTLHTTSAVVFNASCKATATRPLRKTGAGTVTLAAALSGTGPAFWVEEGTLSGTVASALKGPTTVGGGVNAARLAFSRNDVVVDSSSGTLTVLTNGTAQIQRTDWGHFYQYLSVREGGVINCNDYTYALNVQLRGGTLVCGGMVYAAGYWGQGITSQASAQTAWFRGGMSLSGSDAGNPAYITVADGEAPVDLVITGTIAFGGNSAASKPIEKNGAGTLRMTGKSGPNTTAATRLTNGTLLCDNTSGSPLGNAALSVSGGATLGGRGFIGGTARGNVTVAGTAAKPSAIAPGSIDETTGNHLYGTLTVGSESQTNSVTFGANSKLRIELGPSGACDALHVYGSIDLSGSTDTLEVVLSNEKPRSTAYVLASATEGIIGSFDTIVLPLDNAVLTQTATQITLLYNPPTVVLLR